MQARAEGPDPPTPYPPEHVRLWLLATWAGHGDCKADPGPKPDHVRVRRWPELHVADWRMKAQLKAWLNAQVDRGPSFREACRINGWDRRAATRGVEMAIALISIGLSIKRDIAGK